MYLYLVITVHLTALRNVKEHFVLFRRAAEFGNTAEMYFRRVTRSLSGRRSLDCQIASTRPISGQATPECTSLKVRFRHTRCYNRQKDIFIRRVFKSVIFRVVFECRVYSSGSSYYRLSSTSDRIDPGYPRSLRQWKGLPSSVDAVFKDDNNHATYFFKNKQYYRFDDENVRVSINCSTLEMRLSLTGVECTFCNVRVLYRLQHSRPS